MKTYTLTGKTFIDPEDQQLAYGITLEEEGSSNVAFCFSNNCPLQAIINNDEGIELDDKAAFEKMARGLLLPFLDFQAITHDKITDPNCKKSMGSALRLLINGTPRVHLNPARGDWLEDHITVGKKCYSLSDEDATSYRKSSVDMLKIHSEAKLEWVVTLDTEILSDGTTDVTNLSWSKGDL